MKIKKLAAVVIAASTMAVASQSSQALTVGMSDYVESAAGTYVGLLSPTTFDVAGFFNLDVVYSGGIFTNYWAFDVNPVGNNTISANFTDNADIANFSASLYAADAATTCGVAVGSACTIVQTAGSLIQSSTADSWKLKQDQALGRYILVVSGSDTGAQNGGGYTGQMAVRPLPEPGSLALLSMGLLAFGAVRRKAKQG